MKADDGWVGVSCASTGDAPWASGSPAPGGGMRGDLICTDDTRPNQVRDTSPTIVGQRSLHHLSSENVLTTRPPGALEGVG